MIMTMAKLGYRNNFTPTIYRFYAISVRGTMHTSPPSKTADPVIIQWDIVHPFFFIFVVSKLRHPTRLKVDDPDIPLSIQYRNGMVRHFCPFAKPG